MSADPHDCNFVGGDLLATHPELQEVSVSAIPTRVRD
jgi:hypothetical protein